MDICFDFCSVGIIDRLYGFRDGTYEGRSTKDSRGAYSTVMVEIADRRIVSVDFLQYNADGTLKDETYGFQAGEEDYRMAQKALKISSQYAEKLVKTQNVEKVDAITGATTSWEQFQEAAKDALAKVK